jgi:exodeoxyribonuclease VIII
MMEHLHKTAAAGLYPALTEAEYREAPGLNISLLKRMHPTPAHCRQEQLAPREQTEAQRLGQAFHAALLQPAVFRAEYFRLPAGTERRSNAGKAAYASLLADNPGKQPLAHEDFDWIDAACKKLWDSPTVQALLGARGVREASIFWDWPVGARSVRSKGRIDLIAQLESGSGAVVDLKTVPIGGAQPDLFARDVVRYGYDAQAAYYLDGLEVLAPRHRDWIWLVVEKEPPFAHALYQPLPEVVNMGRGKYERWLSRYVSCAESNEWPGYPASVQPLDVPTWAYRDVDLGF